jgi:hypothetical protein
MGCTSSNAPAPPQTATGDRTLLRKPTEAPEIPHSTDAAGKTTISGAQHVTGETALYDVIGELRNQVLGLQAWVKTLIGEDPTTPAKPKESK